MENALLRAGYADRVTADIARELGRPVRDVYAKAGRLGLCKGAEFQASISSGRIFKGGRLGVATQFKPGHVSWNKGTKGLVGMQPECRATQFKAGNRPHTWVPVGSYRINGDGYLDRKVNDLPGPNTVRWHPVHRLVWEAAHGSVPAGHVVVFRPGRKTTQLELITLDAVELITRRELMARNTVHAVYPPELRRVAQLRGALTRQINKRIKDGQ